MKIEDTSQEQLDEVANQTGRLVDILHVYDSFNQRVLALLSDGNMEAEDFRIAVNAVYCKMVADAHVLRDERDAVRAKHLLDDAGILDEPLY